MNPADDFQAMMERVRAQAAALPARPQAAPVNYCRIHAERLEKWNNEKKRLDEPIEIRD